MKPNFIASYSDKSHFGKRTYELFFETIEVKIDSPFVAKIETSFRLSELSPDYSKLQVYSPYLSVGGILMLIGWISYGVITEIVKTNADNSNINFLLALGFIGFFVFLVGLRKQKLVRFQTRGGAPGFDVLAHGPRKTEFQFFVDKLQEQIRKQQLARPCLS